MKESLSDKTILVTGSTDGMGKLIAQHLAMKDAVVLLHGRNRDKGNKVLSELRQQTVNEKLKYYNGDFASLQEVKTLGEEILSENKQIDVLINNVGIGSGIKYKRELSKDGIELRFAVNYLAHVLLTEKLIKAMIPKTSIIINVASVGQELINFSNLMLEKGYEGFFAYKQSKTALIMYTFDLAERLKSESIKVNAIHPASLMNTKMVMESFGYTLSTIEQGADAVENLLNTNTSGKYYDGTQPSKAIAQAYDSKARASLKKITWDLLEKFI